MPLCRDRLTKELNRQGYNIVRYPRASIAPLDVVAGKKSPLNWLGPLRQVWDSEAAEPQPTSSAAPKFDYERTNEIKASLGIRILKGLLSNIGGNADVSISKTSTLSFAYESPTNLSISPFSIGEYLQAGDLRTGNPMLRKYLDLDEGYDSQFYVLSDVLRSKRLVVTITGQNKQSVEADAKALEDMLEGKATVSRKSDSRSEVAFEGDEELTFAFMAYEIGYVDGDWVVLGNQRAAWLGGEEEQTEGQPKIFDEGVPTY